MCVRAAHACPLVSTKIESERSYDFFSPAHHAGPNSDLTNDNGRCALKLVKRTITGLLCNTSEIIVCSIGIVVTVPE